MNSKIYQKPSFKMAKIEMNDLCAGSGKESAVGAFVRQGSKQDFGYARYVGDGTEGMWDRDF